MVSDTGSIMIGVITGFSGPLGPGESPNGVTHKALATAGVDTVSLGLLFGLLIGGPLANTLGASVSVRGSESRVGGDAGSVSVVGVGGVEVGIAGLGVSGPLAAAAEASGFETGGTDAGPAELVGVTVVSVPVVAGFGGGHGGESGQLEI